jgi:hypothetical protein
MRFAGVASILADVSRSASPNWRARIDQVVTSVMRLSCARRPPGALGAARNIPMRADGALRESRGDIKVS